MFITDRDLLVLEPSLFRDVVWIGQRLCKAIGSVSGTALTASGLDTDFVAASIGAGHVVVLDGVSCEVIERTGADQLAVSRPRAASTDPAIPLSPMTDKPLWIVTFAPQVRLIHRQVLGMLGVEPGQAPAPPALPDGSLYESQITNPGDLAALEAYGVLALLLAAAAATAASHSPLSVRASFYRGLFGQERARAVAKLDLDADGMPDAERRLNAALLQRA